MRSAERVVVAVVVVVLLAMVGAVVALTGLVGPGSDGPGPESPRGQQGTPTPSRSPDGSPAPSTPATGPSPTGGGLHTVVRRYPLRVTTANLHQGMSWSRMRADLERLAVPGTDVIGLNEVTPVRAGQIAAWVRTRPGWHYVAPETDRSPWQLDDTLLWNDDRLKLLDSGSIYGSRSRTRFRIDSRWITWARFRHRQSNTLVHYLQTHADPGTAPGGSPRPVPAVADNVTYFRKIRAVAGQFARDGVVIVGGDWNVNARLDRRVQADELPYAILEGRGKGPLVTSYSALGFDIPSTTHLPRHWIDYLAVWGDVPDGAPRLVFRDHRVTTGVNSDHNPLTADLALEVITLVGDGAELPPSAPAHP